MVSLAEEGWTEGSIAESIVRRYLEPLAELSFEPDCIILGCTHFPLLRPAIRQVVPAGTVIVDSASTTAAVAAAMLEEHDLLNDQQGQGRLQLLATDGASRFARVGEQAQYSCARRVSRTGHEALGNELASGDRTRMISVILRLVKVPCITFLSHVLSSFPWSCRY